MPDPEARLVEISLASFSRVFQEESANLKFYPIAQPYAHLSAIFQPMKTPKHQSTSPHEHTASLLSRQLVAKKLGVSAMTVKRYQNKGLLNPIYLSSRAIRYRPEDVENLILDASVLQ